MADRLEKRFYRTSEVADMLGLPASTLRYWEGEFKQLAPRRSRAGQRLYTSDDIRRVELINYLLKSKGLRIEAARQYLADNPGGARRDGDVVARLKEIRGRLQAMIESI